jgi:hypothetical protein
MYISPFQTGGVIVFSDTLWFSPMAKTTCQFGLAIPARRFELFAQILSTLTI